MSSIENELLEFIKKKSLSNTSKIESNTLIFREGIFDSMGFVTLIDFIEETFNIQTSDIDLVEENFESISAMANFIDKKKATDVT